MEKKTAIVCNKQGKKVKYEINRHPSRLNEFSRSGKYKAKKREHQKSSVKENAEHLSAIVK